MRMLVLLTLMVLSILAPVETTRAGGEILYDSKEGTLYRCGPEYEDICWNDGQDGATKVYFGQDKENRK